MFVSRKSLFCFLLSICNLSMVNAMDMSKNDISLSNKTENLLNAEDINSKSEDAQVCQGDISTAEITNSDASTSPSGAKGTLEAEEVYHIGLSKKDIEGAKYAILTGDPGRVSKIASFLKDSKQIACNREYTSYLGLCNGEPVVVTSTGIGGPSTAIAVEELAKLGIKNFIRVGTSGGMQLDVNAGDLVVADSAVRQEGTSKEYAPTEFPAVANFEITSKLCDSAKKITKDLNTKVHVGTVHCKDSFYGQHNPNRMPVSKELNEKWDAWIRLDVKCSEMETASLFVIGRFLKVRTGAVLLVIWNQEQEKRGISQNTDFNTESAIRVVVDAISDLIQKDREDNINKCA